MPPPTTSAKIAIMLVLTLALSLPALADDVNEIPMCKEGATVAMSDDAMDSDTHMGGGGKNMALHMSFTALRPANEADNARAAALVSQLQHALAKYKDYHVAEADGFKPFHPEIKQQKVVHFTKSWYAIKAEFTFNPVEPTSLLYQRTPDGGYKLIGAMYTDRKGATLDELNERVPLERRAMASARQLLHPGQRRQHEDGGLDEVRPQRLDRHQGSLRPGRWPVLSASFRLDGPRLPLGDQSTTGVGALAG